MLKRFFYFVFLISAGSCTQNQTKRNSAITMKVPLIKTVDFYSYSPIFSSYFSDTTAQFPSLDQLDKYVMGKQNAMTKFTDSLLQKNNSDSAILAVNSGMFEFNRRRNILIFEQLQRLPKDVNNMFHLNMIKGENLGVTTPEIISFFKTFPQNVQKSKIGQEFRDKIDKNFTATNKGKDIGQFGKTKLTAPDGRVSQFADVFKTGNKKYPYFILVFGASWCGPCILDEKQLKAWIPAIDTTRIRIIGLSIDGKTNNWLKYLRKEDFPWDNFLLDHEWDNEILKSLNVHYIPTDLLVDSAGKILLQDNDIRSIMQNLSTSD